MAHNVFIYGLLYVTMSQVKYTPVFENDLSIVQ